MKDIKSSKPKRSRSKPRPKPEPYKNQLAKSAIQSLLVYAPQSAALAIASLIFSFFKLAGLVDIAVLLLLVRDIEDIPEKAQRTRLLVKRIVQGLVIFGVSYLFNDTFGMLGSGILLLVLGRFLFEQFGNWLEKTIKKLDRWFRKKGL